MNKITSSLFALTLGAAIAIPQLAHAQLNITGFTQASFNGGATWAGVAHYPTSTNDLTVAGNQFGQNYFPNTVVGVIPGSDTNDLPIANLTYNTAFANTATIPLSLQFGDIELYNGSTLIHDFTDVSLGTYVFSEVGGDLKLATPITIAELNAAFAAVSLTYGGYTISFAPSTNFDNDVLALDTGIPAGLTPPLGTFDVNVSITSTAVPEPATYALWGAALLLGVVAFRRFSGKSVANAA